MSILGRLKPEEAQAVLMRLVALHPELSGEAEAIAQALLCDVSFQTVAQEVEAALRLPGLDELNERAGSSRWGYTSPDEAAWELLEEALQPFVDDMEHYLSLGMAEPALAMCQGMLLALYRLRDARDHEILKWAPEFPLEMAATVFEAWSQGGRVKGSASRDSGRVRTLPAKFLAKHVPEWQGLLGELAARRPARGRSDG